MIKEILIKIGAKVIFIQRNIRRIINNSYENTEENIEKKVTNELLKNNNYKIKNKKIKNILIIIILLFPISVYNFQLNLEIILIIILIILYKKNLPKINEKKKQKEILKVLPFVLRQISIELKAGIGLFDALKTISKSNYGELSEEFRITLNEIQYGVNYNEAFKKLTDRINLEIFTKVIHQIVRTLNNGGNLSNTLDTIANENSKNMKIKYKEYSEKLNSIMILYMFIAVLIPVIVFVMIIASTTVMGSIIKPELLIILYLFFFPLIISMIIIFIKSMEPTI